MDKKKTIILIVIAVVLALILGGGALIFLDYKGIINLPGNFLAEEIAEEAIEESIEDSMGGDADVEIGEDDNSVSIETEDGSFYSSEVSEWPSDIPITFPKFDGGVIEHAAKSEYEGGLGSSWILSFNSVSNSDIDSYKSLLESEGFEVGMDLESGESRMITAGKEEFAVLVSFDNANNEMSMTLSIE